ncbi:LysR substrate-binding domain-containing protein [Lacticigenium naphthae]|uniref:LysR substrate-binding domain-containing protein n=1 Tax=Lacticigenium naphthae TaxID=515351 RepID=UPI000405CD5A|nr:LysR substrate-binding domain-containing protein [Lacticigenium naphthae]
MLDYRYITFLMVAKELNYTKAAKKLALSQPAVSKHIHYIENHLNTKLVNYQDRKLSLTKKGEYLKIKIEEIQNEIESIKVDLIDDKSACNLRLGASRTIGEFYIPTYTQLLNIPDIKIDLIVDNTTQLLNLLEDEKIDYAFISGPIDASKYHTRPFYNDKIVLVCSPKHPLANRTVELEELFSENLLAREMGSGVCDSVEHYLLQQGVSCDQFHQTTRIGNIALLKTYIANNEGIGFLYAISVVEELQNESLATISIENFSPYQDFFLVCNKKKQKEKDIEKLIHLFTKNLNTTV